DPVEAGLRQAESELEALAAKLSGGPEAMPETPVDPLNSDAARDAGYAIASGLGELFRAVLFRERREKLVQANQRPRSRFTSPAHAAAAPPLRPAATAPPPAALSPGVQSEPPKTSGTPSTPNTMSFVGFLDDRPRAAGSSR